MSARTSQLQKAEHALERGDMLGCRQLLSELDSAMESGEFEPSDEQRAQLSRLHVGGQSDRTILIIGAIAAMLLSFVVTRYIVF